MSQVRNLTHDFQGNEGVGIGVGTGRWLSMVLAFKGTGFRMREFD